MPREPSWWYRPPGLISELLRPVAAVYGTIARRRLGQAPAFRSSLPVVCVGNFTAGGSGKTPFTLMLAARLSARGERPVILSRGYGGEIMGPHWVDPARDGYPRVGDEPLMLARVAPVMVARNRIEGAREIERRGDGTVIIMDDGLQNPTLAKTLTFAIVDGVRGLGNGAVIPAGPLRAPLATQLGSADAIVFNGSGFRPETDALRHGGRPIIDAELMPSNVAAWLSGQRWVAYAGIGNPERFFDTVRSRGGILVETVSFPDHARYSDRDARHLMTTAERLGAKLITTEKDFVRLTGSPALIALAASSAVVPVVVTLSDGSAERLDRLLDGALGAHK
jgi:tetraacyldisaccharide 4'-kinase